MHYLNKLESCCFARHPCSVVLSKMLKTIRRTEMSTLPDTIAVQAVLELMDESGEYGPFRIKVSAKTKYIRNIKVYKDCILITDLDKKDTDVTVNYLREEQNVLEELCEIADAHAVLKNK